MSARGSSRYTLGVVTDEIDQDLKRALSVTNELGLRVVDLNSVRGKNVSQLTEQEIGEIKRLLNFYGCRVGMISTPFLKALPLTSLEYGHIQDNAEFRKHMSILRKAIQIARALDAGLVRTFSFHREEMWKTGEIPGKTLDKIREGLGLACKVAQDEGITLGLENVRSCYGNTGENVRCILDAVSSPVLKATWDPVNAYVSGGIAYPDGYEAIKPYIVHVHIKDAKIIDEKKGLTAWMPVGEGCSGIDRQIKALIQDGYDKTLCLETHWVPKGGTKEEGTRQSFKNLMKILEGITE